MRFNLDILRVLIDRYFSFYSKNPVSSVKIAFEIYAWLTVNFMFEFISGSDLNKALDYVNEQIAKREESKHGL